MKRTTVFALPVMAVLLAPTGVLANVFINMSQLDYVAPPGVTLRVNVQLVNADSNVVYLNGLSSTLGPEFAGAAAIFFTEGPDSLQPGEVWNGGLLEFQVPTPETPSVRTHSVTLIGGGHRYAGDILGSASFILDDSTTVTGVPDKPVHGPRAWIRPAPNPFQASTRIEFTLPGGKPARVSIHDIRGALVQRFDSVPVVEGKGSFEWKGETLAGRKAGPGIYLIRVTGENVSISTKVVLVESGPGNR